MAEHGAFPPLPPETTEAVAKNFNEQLHALSTQLLDSVHKAGGQPPDVLVLLAGLISVVVGTVCRTTEESHNGALNLMFNDVKDRLARGREGWLKQEEAEQDKAASE